MSMTLRLKERLRAGAWHLLVSVLVALAVTALVFGLWFPGAYRYMAGGTGLLLLIMGVDVVLGPLLTFAVFDRRKGVRHLQRDIATIAAIQLAALAYGFYTVQLARPVALVFEHDRFRIVSAADVVNAELPEALPEFRHLPLDGPRLMAVRKTHQGAERNEALAAAVLDGVDTSQRPRFWTPYGKAERDSAFQVARPMGLLEAQYSGAGSLIQQAVLGMGLTVANARFLPVRARNDAVAVLAPDGNIAGFLPYDGFF
jgi:hypothetical protein